MMNKNIFLIMYIFLVTVLASLPRFREEFTCGVPKTISGLIVSGINIRRGDFPWIVALTYTKMQMHHLLCSGTLISSTFVVSGETYK